MNLAITIEADSELDEVMELISALRDSHVGDVKVLEAPPGFESLYPVPLLTVEVGQVRERMFGADAVARLRDLAKQAA